MNRPGRLLHVDLTAGIVRERPLPAVLLRAYLGGRGLGVRLLRDTLHLVPDHPDQPIALVPGLLCGRGAPTCDRLSSVFRSPSTGLLSHNSDGGALALQLQRSGFAALLISGQSPTPVILELTPGGAALRDGRELWGLAADATVTALSRSGAGVAAIGPAGEQRVNFANLHYGDGNVTGRGGLGALFGRKRLKAIVVVGTEPRAVADPVRFDAACADLLRLFRASPVLLGELGFSRFGTAALLDLAGRRGLLALDNFRTTAPTSICTATALKSQFGVVGHGCNGCPIACKLRTPEGAPLPEYETIAAFAALLGADALPAPLAANALCNRLGLDPLATAATLATRAELLGRAPTADELEALLLSISGRTGEGARLADGALRFAALHGRPELALTIKGLELGPLDPRAAQGVALSLCVSTGNAGGQVLLGMELLRKPMPVERLSLRGKGRMVRLAEDVMAASDSLGLCRHALLGAGVEEFAALCAAATGQECQAAELLAIGERVVLSERCDQAAHGVTAADEMLPPRFFTAPDAEHNPSAPPALDRARLAEELQRYYRIRGLDPAGRVAAGWLEAQP